MVHIVGYCSVKAKAIIDLVWINQVFKLTGQYNNCFEWIIRFVSKWSCMYTYLNGGLHIKLFVEYLYGRVEVLQIISGISDTVA